MMPKVKVASLLLLSLFVASARRADAQDIPQISGIDSIVAKTQRQIGQNHRQLIENVELKLGDSMLYADEVEWLERLSRLLPQDARIVSARLRRPVLVPPVDASEVLDR
jgi:hypothetical protein